MKNWHQKLFIMVIVCLLALPMTYMFGVKVETVIYGVESVTELPSLQEKSWKDRTFQRNFEKWWTSHFGFRKLALKTKNTLYDLVNLNKIHAGYNRTLIETTNGNLIEELEISLLYNEPCRQNEALLAPKLQKLVRTLQADNRQILFVLGSTKAHVYEDEIPERFKFFAHKKFDVYSYWEDLLKRLNIPYFNTVPMMKEMAKKEGYEPYARTGTHWAAYGAARVTQGILKRLGLEVPTIQQIAMVDKAPFDERDIANLMNSFITYLPNERFPRVTLAPPKSPIKKNFVVLGDSYTHSFRITVVRNKYVDPRRIFQICNRLIKEEEISDFFNNKDVYLFVNRGNNWNRPRAWIFQNIDKILKRMPTHFMHDWLRDERGGFVSTDKSRIVIPNVDKNDIMLKLTTSQVGGKLVVNGKEIVIDKQQFETVLPGKDTDGKYRFLVTLKTEKPVTLSQITVQPLLSVRTYNFANKTLPIETFGLSYAGSWGRWSDGDVVKLQLEVPQNKPLKFTFRETHAFVPAENPLVTADVFANGRKVGTWTFRYKVPHPKTEFVVPPSILKIKRPLELMIKIKGAVSPAELGMSDDKRKIGLGLHSLIITTAQ